MTMKDHAAALDAAEKSLAQKGRGKPLEPKRLEFCGCMVGPNYPDPECHSCLGSGNPTYGSRIEALEFELRAKTFEIEIANEQIERLQDASRPKVGHDIPPPSHRVCLGNPRDLSGKPLGKTKHTDSDTLYFVGRLNGFAHAAMSGGMTDSPFGKTLREAAQHMERLADANGAMLEAIQAVNSIIDQVFSGNEDANMAFARMVDAIGDVASKAEGRAS